jgi:hypothetical protein
MGEVSSRIIKGGALLEETRRFVEMWDDGQASQQNLEEFRTRNLLGKRSRVRAEDTLAILRQRFVEPGPQVVKALRTLAFSAEAFRDACYFEAARNDGLLAHVAGKVLYEMGNRGWAKVTVEDVQDALLRDPPAAVVAEWGQSTRTRVIHGLLSALRDFGVLEGKATKHIAPPHMAFGGFVYVLGRLRQGTTSSHDIVSSPVWRWWLLEDREIRGYFLEADREGLLRYADAGSTVRIDWRIDSLEEMARAVG